MNKYTKNLTTPREKRSCANCKVGYCGLLVYVEQFICGVVNAGAVEVNDRGKFRDEIRNIVGKFCRWYI